MEPQEVKNPKLVCIVGCLGLFSNIVGLLLFHDHTHGHGHSHGETAEDTLDSAEQGYGTQEADMNTSTVRDETGTVASVMPSSVMDTWQTGDDVTQRGISSQFGNKNRGSDSHRHNSRRFSGSMSRFGDVDNIHIHPASLRQDIIKASRFDDDQSSESDVEQSEGGANNSPHVTERSRLLNHSGESGSYAATNGGHPRKLRTAVEDDLHGKHNHAQPKEPETKKGHSHDLNMRGVFLHVMGDALGNIGVIASALIIWLTNYSWRYYVDPGISLLITVIILASAIPLCKAASRILLQAVPAGLSIDHIIEDIEQLPGVLSCHHLHVWQLSDTKLVASLHIQVSHDIKGEGSDHYMFLARQVRKCLHAYGIHSSTIQPEFYPESESGDAPTPGAPFSGDGEGGDTAISGRPTPANSERGEGSSTCLLECGEECAAGRQCCPGNGG